MERGECMAEGEPRVGAEERHRGAGRSKPQSSGCATGSAGSSGGRGCKTKRWRRKNAALESINRDGGGVGTTADGAKQLPCPGLARQKSQPLEFHGSQIHSYRK